MRRPSRRKESGFALLLVFLMASVLAITLYLEIPRVAFEAQRQKEQLLIDRGEQYKRAIKVFFNTNKRYPASIQELESFNNKRSLRKRYVDPMTGKDEWRVIHIQNGILTDSKVVQPQKSGQQQTASTAGQYVGEQTYIGQPATGTATSGVNVAQRRRASDDRPAGLSDAGSVGMPVVINPNGDPNMAGQPGTQPGQVQAGQLPPGVTAPVGVPGMPGQAQGMPFGGGRFPGQINVPGQNTGTVNSGGTYVGGGGSYVGGGGSYVGGTPVVGSQPNAPGMLAQYPGAPVNSQTGGVVPGYNTMPGSNGIPPAYGQPGLNTQGQNAAVGMINNLLTTPRVMPGAGGASAGGLTVGGGIAGFASNSEQEGIKVYNDRTNYSEWEFTFDLAKDNITPRNPVTGAAGTPASQLGNTQGMGTGGMNPIGAQPPGMGQGPGFGGRGGAQMPAAGGRR